MTPKLQDVKIKNVQQTTILFILLSVWVSALTAFFVWLFWTLKGLIKSSKGKDFLSAFKKIQDGQQDNSKDIKNLQAQINSIDTEVLGHIQKVGLIKFNPFSETGGEHSFSLALLDGKKNGIIITSLHSRETTRVYIKDVKSGKSSIELSKEEERSLGEALKK